jgi:hypothetical protein
VQRHFNTLLCHFTQRGVEHHRNFGAHHFEQLQVDGFGRQRKKFFIIAYRFPHVKILVDVNGCKTIFLCQQGLEIIRQFSANRVFLAGGKTYITLCFISLG